MQIGQKLKALRVQYGLTQQELASRTELSKGFISQLERDLTSPSIATLVDILECLGTDLKHFFNDDFEERVLFTPEDIFVKESPEDGYTIEWLITNAQKNAMEPIVLTLQPGAQTLPDVPHEGEEFGYVLSGQIVLHLGSHSYKAKKGDSFYYTSTQPHYLHNISRSTARILWVASPPTF